MPSDRDTNLFISPAKARELQSLLDWYRRFQGKVGGRIRPGRPSGSPPLDVGKAHDNIAPRTYGAVEVWIGAPGSETEYGPDTSPVQRFNLLDRTITAGKWLWTLEDFIVGAHFPARFVDCTLTGSLSSGGSASATVVSHFDGDAPINSDGTTASTITVSMPALTGLTPIDSGKTIRTVWNDVAQRYEALQWGCS